MPHAESRNNHFNLRRFGSLFTYLPRYHIRDRCGAWHQMGMCGLEQCKPLVTMNKTQSSVMNWFVMISHGEIRGLNIDTDKRVNDSSTQKQKQIKRHKPKYQRRGALGTSSVNKINDLKWSMDRAYFHRLPPANGPVNGCFKCLICMARYGSMRSNHKKKHHSHIERTSHARLTDE